ncbi:alpha-N-acetylgalactosamine-specific lectin-like [Pomacea canaliculata]|uniref:alpha-N-acetylgalactosamine-specific lectin-like n=1 Tax=Pomacea canaliculata TaxID=400727 RepID=UPI000D7352E3|nr:alpha-N-acetylgalactosamine-specific lectin-like [Pomacea canaliculata]
MPCPGVWTRVYIADAALCSDIPRSLLYEPRDHIEKYRRIDMAASRSPRLTIVMLLALTCVATVTLGGCPVERGYVLCDNRCLKLYTIKQDYQTAKTRCEADGAHLFFFKSRDQDVPALQYLLDTRGEVLQGIAQGLWVGATDIEVEGQFVWSDNSCVPTNTGLWAHTQPDNYLNNEDCVVVGISSGIMLNDLPCSSRNGYVCQVDI